MATIKTQLVDGQRRIITKTVNGVRRVSCSCCCFCRNYDLDYLLYGDGRSFLDGSLIAEECGDAAAFIALRPDINYRKFPACLRWICRQTVLDDGGPITIGQAVGGPTTNNRDLNDLILECLGERDGFAGLANGLPPSFPPEEYGKCYLYTFEFYGWHKSRKPRAWISSDFLFDLYRAETPPQ